jgi:hypothetical protein
MEIVFRGLCAFARRKEAGEDYAEISLLDDGHHKAVLVARVADVNEKTTTWEPTHIFAAPDDEPLMIWELGGIAAMEVRTSGSSKYWDRDEVLDLAVHQNTTPKNPVRGVLKIFGGKFDADASKFAVKLAHVNTGKAPGTKKKVFADKIQWDGTTVDVTSGRGAITFKSSDPTVSISNEAAHPGNGINHFSSYYSLFALESGDKPTTVAIASEDELTADFVSLGWNCINPSEVP